MFVSASIFLKKNHTYASKKIIRCPKFASYAPKYVHLHPNINRFEICLRFQLTIYRTRQIRNNNCEIVKY